MLAMCLFSTLAYLKRGEETLAYLESANNTCFADVFVNLTQRCENFTPHSAAHNVLALRLTNCYREQAGLIPIICAAYLGIHSQPQVVAKCMRQIAKLDNSESILQLFAIQSDRVVDSCFYLNFYNFYNQQKQASIDLLASAQQASQYISLTSKVQTDLHSSMEKSVELTREIGDFLKMNQAQQVLQLQNSNSLLKQIVSNSYKGNEQIEHFQEQYSNFTNVQLGQQYQLVGQLIDIGIALGQAVSDVGEISNHSHNAMEAVTLITRQLNEYIDAQSTLLSQMQSITNISHKIEDQLDKSSERLSNSQQSLQKDVGQINQDIQELRKVLDRTNSRFSVFNLFNKTPAGFINFHLMVVLALMLADFLFDAHVEKKISLLFAVGELVTHNIVKSICKAIYCGVFVPVYCYLSKSQLVQFNKTSLLENGSYSVYLYLKLFKILPGATCENVIDELRLSFNMQWVVYVQRTLEIFMLVRYMLQHGKQSGVPKQFYKTFFTPNATKVKTK